MSADEYIITQTTEASYNVNTYEDPHMITDINDNPDNNLGRLVDYSGSESGGDVEIESI